MVVSMSAVDGFLRSGKLKTLLIRSRQRSVLFTDVPTGTEAGFPTFNASNWMRKVFYASGLLHTFWASA